MYYYSTTITITEREMVEADDLQYELFRNAIYCKKNHDGMEVLPICRMKVKIGEEVVQIFNCHLMSNNCCHQESPKEREISCIWFLANMA